MLFLPVEAGGKRRILQGSNRTLKIKQRNHSKETRNTLSGEAKAVLTKRREAKL